MIVSKLISDLDTALRASGKITSFNTKEFICRCPFCGDSMKSEYSMHLYISLSYPHPFYCQRCNTSGPFLSLELISTLEIYSDDINSNVLEIRRKVSVFGVPKKTHPNTLDDIIKWKYPVMDTSTWLYNQAYSFLTTPNSKFSKMDEFFTPYEIDRYKVFLGIYDFINLNGLEKTISKHDSNLLERLNSYYIGFGNLDGSQLVFRNVVSSNKGMRYYNYNIFKSEKVNLLYGVSKNVNLENKYMTLVISEGILDLIQIERLYYTDIYDRDSYYSLATNGFGLVNSLKHFICRFGIIPKHVHFYIDNDPPKQYEGKMYDNLLMLKKSLFKLPFLQSINVKIYQNAIDKDFGMLSQFIQRKELY